MAARPPGRRRAPLAVLLAAGLAGSCGGGERARPLGGGLPPATGGAPDAAAASGGSGGDTSADAAPPPGPPWRGLEGPLGGGAWGTATRVDGVEGGSGSCAFAPDGRLFVLYSLPGAPQPLELRVRAADGDAFSPEREISPNAREGNVFFSSGGSVYVATENVGTASVWRSDDAGGTWAWEVSFSARAQGAETAYHRAFLAEPGGRLALYFGYTTFNSVVGSEAQTVQLVVKDAGGWPADPRWLAPELKVKALHGAFVDGAGAALVVATAAFRSAAEGSEFVPAVAGGAPLSAVVAAARNPVDGAVLLLERVPRSVDGDDLVVWGTRDLGASFTRLGAVPVERAAGDVAIAASGNRVVLAFASPGAQGGVLAATSLDEGGTWAPASPPFASTELAQVGALRACAAAGGEVALVASVDQGGSPAGVLVATLR